MPATPMWRTIAESVSADIAAGKYRPGDKLPTEAEFARRFAVHRHTVRRALSGLIDNGVIVPRQGAGVYVAQDVTEYPLGSRVRLSRNLMRAGRTAHREVLALETRAGDATETGALGLDPGAEVIVYEGISMADDSPIALFCSVFPAAALPGLKAALADLNSVTAALKSVGVADYLRVSTRITAQIATPVHVRHLRLRPGAPILRSVAVNVDPKGRPVEYGRTWFSGDRITLTLDASEG